MKRFNFNLDEFGVIGAMALDELQKASNVRGRKRAYRKIASLAKAAGITGKLVSVDLSFHVDGAVLLSFYISEEAD